MTKAEVKKIKAISGVVTSDSMDKTIVVSVDSVKQSRLYKKKFTISKKYKVHDENNDYKVGDIVEFASSRPMSRGKHYVAIRKVS